MKHLFIALGLLWQSIIHAEAQSGAVMRPTAEEHTKSVAAFQEELNTEYRDPAKSPLPAPVRKTFTALPFYPANYGACVVSQFVRDSTSAPFEMPTSTARRPLYRKYGELRFTLDGKPQRLSVYQNLELLHKPGLEDYLFVPFTDRTNGHGSYGGGRYLDLRLGQIKNGQLLLDFNRAYNPYCAYSPLYSCPVPPAENRLPVEVKAGVMSDH
jgi:uncharacterized protein (DUF1684 family)